VSLSGTGGCSIASGGLLTASFAHCALRPQGTLCYLDEMVSWVDKIVDKNSNEDRAAWLMGYNSDQYNRVS
jgi:hypothetical protein